MTSPFLERAAEDHVASNALAFAIRDAYPVSPGHTLVVPRRLFASWFEATPEERAAIFELVTVMALPDPESQVQFLFNVQRLLSDGSFVATYKYALLLSLADLVVESGDDTTEDLPLDTRDLAERFVGLYWRQVLPWVHGGRGSTGLQQATGPAAAILNRIAGAHDRVEGSLTRLKRDRAAWDRLLREVARIIEVMPLWRLQTVGRQRLAFLYPNVGKGGRIRLNGEAVYCFRRFRDFIGDMTETAWVRFVRRLPRNQGLIAEGPDLAPDATGRSAYPGSQAAGRGMRATIRAWPASR